MNDFYLLRMLGLLYCISIDTRKLFETKENTLHLRYLRPLELNPGRAGMRIEATTLSSQRAMSPRRERSWTHRQTMSAWIAKNLCFSFGPRLCYVPDVSSSNKGKDRIQSRGWFNVGNSIYWMRTK